MPAKIQNNQIKSVGGVAHTTNPQYTNKYFQKVLKVKIFTKKKKKKKESEKKSPGLYPVS